MKKVRAKKHLGQHFLADDSVATSIVAALTGHGGYHTIMEIGPGMGVLSQHLVGLPGKSVYLIEVDSESVEYLRHRFPDHASQLLHEDFLRLEMGNFETPLGLIGNLPYNISSQIFFKVLENRQRVSEMVCMVQKEVGDRLCSPPGNKQYGILSVLLQAFYDLEKIRVVKPGSFDPPPKVNSLVVRLQRNTVTNLGCDEKRFFKVVKQAFQNRRKTLRNALKSINLPLHLQGSEILSQRAEQLTVDQFVWLTNAIDNDS